MIRSTIGAIIGSSLTKGTPAAGGAAGAAIAAAVPFVISRISIPSMIAIGVGSYLMKRHLDQRDEETAASPRSTHASNGDGLETEGAGRTPA
jgi:hypothetical protein